MAALARVATRAYSSSAATASFARNVGAGLAAKPSAVPSSQSLFAGKGGYATFEVRPSDGTTLKAIYGLYAVTGVVAVTGLVNALLGTGKK